MTAADLLQRLRLRYAPQGREWVTLAEVANGTGAAASRSCDFLAISLWGSGRWEWHGHEIKVSRSDWLREIRDPDKADAFARYCDRWWIVAGDSGIVAPGELREGWGLMLPRGDGLVVKIGAPKREPAVPSRHLLAAIFRRCMEASPGEDERRQLCRETSDLRYKLGETQSRLTQAQHAHERLQKDLEAFEERSGLRIDGYSGPRLAEDLQRLWALQTDQAALDRAKQIAVHVRELLMHAEAAERALAEIVGGQEAAHD